MKNAFRLIVEKAREEHGFHNTTGTNAPSGSMEAVEEIVVRFRFFYPSIEMIGDLHWFLRCRNYQNKLKQIYAQHIKMLH